MPDVTVSTEQQQALAELARSHRWRLVVLFGSTARTGKGRDVDLAVLPSGDVSSAPGSLGYPRGLGFAAQVLHADVVYPVPADAA
jgi:predicted nucleotidyltransferase